MTTLTCPTCHFALDGPVAFCPRCGWPAGHLAAPALPGGLALPPSGAVVAPLVLHNTGAGPVEYAVEVEAGQDWAFLQTPRGERSRIAADRRLEPGAEDNGLRVGVQAEDVPASTVQVALVIRSSDATAPTINAPRPWNPERSRWRSFRVLVPVRRLGRPQVTVGAGLVAFTARGREARVYVHNAGGPTTLQLEGLPADFLAGWEPVIRDGAQVLDVSLDGPELTPVPTPFELGGDSAAHLVLRAPAAFEGAATVRLAGDEGFAQELTLYGEPSARTASLVRHWTVGIDFGTAKSAVYFTDNWVPVAQRSPEPVLWPSGPRSHERTLPTTRSAVLYRAGTATPLCGHQVPVAPGAEAPDERVIQSIKTLLRDGAETDALRLPDGRVPTPVEVVSEFLSYLLGEVRGAQAFRAQPEMDARFVLTLPVMEERSAFLKQRGNTLLAARQAGLPVDELLTPSEPECAALDLMHCLATGRYAFGGRPYQLQDGEVLLVLDCGAGTTDLAILRIGLQEGQFGADQLAAAGYRFGGDGVDDLLLSWVLEQRAEEVRFGYDERRAWLHVPPLRDSLPFAAAREEARRVKESLFIAGAPDAPRPFHTDLGTFELAPTDLERLVATYLEALFRTGVMPDPRALFPRLNAGLDDRLRLALWRELMQAAGTPMRSVEQVLADANLRRSDVTFLFITGGSGQIPLVRTYLGQFMGNTQRGLVADPEDCTINVARGAALYHEYRVTGVLKCAIDIVGRDPRDGSELLRERALAPGALPGPQVERAVAISPRESLVIALEATYPEGGPRGDLDHRHVANPGADEARLVVRVGFGSDHALYWEAALDDTCVVARETLIQA
jgi:molecular chaperone DnaK (HSP70)